MCLPPLLLFPPSQCNRSEHLKPWHILLHRHDCLHLDAHVFASAADCLPLSSAGAVHDAVRPRARLNDLGKQRGAAAVAPRLRAAARDGAQ